MVDSAQVNHLLAIDPRFYLVDEIFLLCGILGLTGQDDGQPNRVGDTDSAGRVFVRSHTSNEGQILTRFSRQLVHLEIAAVIDGAHIAAAFGWRCRNLRVADGGNGHLRILAQDPLLIHGIQSGVDGVQNGGFR